MRRVERREGWHIERKRLVPQMMRGVLATVVAVAVLAGAFLAIQSGAFNPTHTSSPAPTATATPTFTTSLPSPDVTASLAPTPSATPSPSPTPEPTPVDTSVTASAVVVPIRHADLATRAAGVVESIYVPEGAQVSANQLLLRLEQTSYLNAIQSAASRVTEATQAVTQAQLQVNQLPPDASPGQIESVQANLRLAQAGLDVARAALTAAQDALLLTEIRAPFPGTIAEVSVEIGEQAVAGQPVIAIGDLSAWFIETTDLSELEVVRVGVGDRAELTFEALPGLTLGGTVDRIQPRGVASDGSVFYAVFIEPDSHEPRLRWGMSATVRIVPTE